MPRSRAALAALPGVGNKTAGVVTVHIGGEPAFPVDTHVRRLARRLGFSRSLVPDRIEEDLQALFPTQDWAQGHQLLVWHGRRTCFARKPACDRCVVAAFCPKVGVPKARPLAAGSGAAGALQRLADRAFCVGLGPLALPPAHALADEDARQRREVVQVDAAQQVVGLVLDGNGQKPLARRTCGWPVSSRYSTLTRSARSTSSASPGMDRQPSR